MMLQEIDLSQIDLNLLVLFDVVMRERHVGRTAARMHLSPSAVSHGLARLRRVLHDPLFLKHPKGVVPTDRAGQLAAPIGGSHIATPIRWLARSASPKRRHSGATTVRREGNLRWSRERARFTSRAR
jgi:hypothetical protein